MKILVTNDDGIYSDGLWRAIESLKVIGEVVVVAPDREMSGSGGSITLNSPIRARKVKIGTHKIPTYAVEGTPADCVILALKKLVGPVDLVVSGINSGANIGTDVLVSGTVGATLQSYSRGIPSIAISVTALKPTSFDTAAEFLKGLIQQSQQDIFIEPILLNINVPNIPRDTIKGIEITRLAQTSFLGDVIEENDGKRPYYWISREKPKLQIRKGTDIWAIRRRNCISITPLHTNMTKSGMLPKLKDISINLLPLLQQINRG